MAIDVDFSRFEDCQISLWEIKQRAFYFGQKIVNERIEIRNAIANVASSLYSDEEKETDDYSDELLSIVYKKIQPLSIYAKNRRNYMKTGEK